MERQVAAAKILLEFYFGDEKKLGPIRDFSLYSLKNVPHKYELFTFSYATLSR